MLCSKYILYFIKIPASGENGGAGPDSDVTMPE